MSTTIPTELLGEPLKTIAGRMGRRWWLLLIPGIAWIVIGFAVLRYDAATVAVIAIVFGIVVLLAAVGEVVAVVVSAGGWRVFHLVFAALLVLAAVEVFVDPAGTFVSLAFVVGFYFVFIGIFDVVTSLFEIGTVPGWWLRLVSGILQLLLGFLASSSLGNAASVLVTVVSIAALFRGLAEISAAFSVRAASRALARS
jgi:uncharacterized membrane protein HdeD (DUF308 family)